MKKGLLGLALLGGAIAVASKMLESKKSNWEGLTESEVRAKLEERIPHRVPDDKRAAVADRVVTEMRDRGVLADEAADPERSATAGDTGVEPSSEPPEDPEPSDPARGLTRRRGLTEV